MFAFGLLFTSFRTWYVSIKDPLKHFWLSEDGRWGQCANGIWWVEDGDVVKHLVMHRLTLHIKELSDPKCQ